MATNEETLTPTVLVVPTAAGSRGPPGNLFISGTKLLMMSGTQLVEITKA
jgi:hypothetical protein